MVKKGQQAAVGVIIVGVIVFFVALISLMMGFDTVEANHRGVMVEFGNIKGTMMPGTKWTGMFTDVIQYDLRMRQMTVSMVDTGAAVDKDGQSVYATIDINYKLVPGSIESAYAEIGTDNDMANVLVVEGIVKESFKSVTSKYTSTEIWQNRDKVKSEAISKIKENFPSEYFTLENVVVTNLDYNPSFKAAIEAQKTNEKLALAKEAEVKIAQYEADKSIQNARGAAESKKLNAEADAYIVLTQAKAEAEGLSLKKQQITPLTIQSDMIAKWSGNFPQYLIQTGAGGSNYLLNLPALPATTVTN